MLGVLALVVGATPAWAAPGATYQEHGTVLTTADIGAPGEPVHIYTISTHPSTFTMMGRVSLDQTQLVFPSTFQRAEVAPGVFVEFPASGLIEILPGTLTAADRTDTLTIDAVRDAIGQAELVPFTMDESVTAPNGLHPITFQGHVAITGGSGRFSGAHGTLAFQGGFCFYSMQGFLLFDGSITLDR